MALHIAREVSTEELAYFLETTTARLEKAKLSDDPDEKALIAILEEEVRDFGEEMKYRTSLEEIGIFK